MVAPVQCWAVRLSGSLREVEGTLELASNDLVFTASDGSSFEPIPLASLRKARRVRGSPVMVVQHETGSGVVRTAFFFTKPPPIEPTDGTRRRKARKQAVHYLEISNVDHKERIKGWIAAIEEARSGPTPG